MSEPPKFRGHVLTRKMTHNDSKVTNVTFESFSSQLFAEKKKAYTTTAERKSFGELFWLQRRTFHTGGRYKSPIKTRKAISATKIFPLWPLFSEAWGPPQFQEKRSRSEKAILGALGEFQGVLGALGIGNSILGIRNSILGMASHDLINTKPTILGATLGAIPAIAADPPEIFSFAPAFSERFFKNWGGPRAPDFFRQRNVLHWSRAVYAFFEVFSLESL